MLAEVEAGKHLGKLVSLWEQIYKVRARTGRTRGVLNMVKHDVRWKAFDGYYDMVPSPEHCVISPGDECQPSVKSGDSDSFCFSPNDEWARLVWGRSSGLNCKTVLLGYVSDPNNLLEDGTLVASGAGRRVKL